MQAFTPIQMTLSLNLDTYSKWEQLAKNSAMQSVVDIEICKIHTDLNVAISLTKLLSKAKHDHTLVLFGC